MVCFWMLPWCITNEVQLSMQCKVYSSLSDESMMTVTVSPPLQYMQLTVKSVHMYVLVAPKNGPKPKHLSEVAFSFLLYIFVI
jgi:hypothetical protein